jgi:HEAT repeat protein
LSVLSRVSPEGGNGFRWRKNTLMSDLKYERVNVMTQAELESGLASTNPGDVERALYSATYSLDDWEWVQNRCLERLAAENVGVRWAAAQCLGDLAQIRGQLDVDRVVPALKKALDDEDIRSTVQDSLDLIESWQLRTRA